MAACMLQLQGAPTEAIRRKVYGQKTNRVTITTVTETAIWKLFVTRLSVDLRFPIDVASIETHGVD